MAASYLHKTYGTDFTDLDIPFNLTAGKDQLSFLSNMIDKKINSPLTSSIGRLFDGVSSLVGLRNHSTFEGQAAMELEMAAVSGSYESYPYQVPDKQNPAISI